MSIVDILGLLGCSTVIGGTISFFIQRGIKKRDVERERGLAEQREMQRKEQEQIKKKTEELEKQNLATMLGVQALLRDRLLQAFKHYAQKGFADYQDRTNVENMYKQYEALGPNSVMDDMYEQFKELPTMQ